MEFPLFSPTDSFRLNLESLFASIRESFTRGNSEFRPCLGEVTEFKPLSDQKWELTRERKNETGFAYFEVASEKWSGVLRIAWERYPNGQYLVQSIDDVDGFEVFNRSPSIIPPDLEIAPGTYVWRRGAFRRAILAFSERELSIACVDKDGFITWEQTGRHQMVGRRLHMVDILERSRERTRYGFKFTEWQQIPDTVYRVRKNSEFEFEFLLGRDRRAFTREELIRGPMGYAYNPGQRIRGNGMRPRQWKNKWR